MNLWIRTQDRLKFVPINKVIQICNPKEDNKIAKLAGYDFMDKKFDDIDGINYIRDFIKLDCYSLTIDTMVLGNYKTKERALEILDEISNLLKPKAIIQTIDKDAGIGDLVGKPQLKEQSEIIPLSNNIVYEMPEE